MGKKHPQTSLLKCRRRSGPNWAIDVWYGWKRTLRCRRKRSKNSGAVRGVVEHCTLQESGHPSELGPDLLHGRLDGVDRVLNSGPPSVEHRVDILQRRHPGRGVRRDRVDLIQRHGLQLGNLGVELSPQIPPQICLRIHVTCGLDPVRERRDVVDVLPHCRLQLPPALVV